MNPINIIKQWDALPFKKSHWAKPLNHHHKHLQRRSYTRRKTTGFTILEIIVATILISLLVSSGIYFVDITKKREVVEKTIIELSMLRNFPSAIIQVYQSKRTLANVTAQDLIDTREVQANEPIDWAIGTSADNLAPNINDITVVFTFTVAEQATAVREFLADRLSSNLISAVASPGGNAERLHVTYTL